MKRKITPCTNELHTVVYDEEQLVFRIILGGKLKIDKYESYTEALIKLKHYITS